MRLAKPTVVICFQKRIFDILINNESLREVCRIFVVICFPKRIFDILINNNYHCDNNECEVVICFQKRIFDTLTNNQSVALDTCALVVIRRKNVSLTH